jgi:hypothetical protein
MNIRRNNDRRAAGITSQTNLTQAERDYMDAWENADPEWRKQVAEMGLAPDLGKQGGPVIRDDEDHDPFATIAAPQPDRYFDDEPEPEETPISRNPADAVLRVLYVLTGSKHPSLRLRAECLLAIINRTEETSQAAIARKHGLTRAAISKTMRDMRKGEYLAGLEIFFFGGRQDVSEQARTRAIRVHQQQKEKHAKWKPSNKINKLLEAC